MASTKMKAKAPTPALAKATPVMLTIAQVASLIGKDQTAIAEAIHDESIPGVSPATCPLAHGVGLLVPTELLGSLRKHLNGLYTLSEMAAKLGITRKEFFKRLKKVMSAEALELLERYGDN
jgi:AraC-like DNA-binding protein